MLSRFGKDTSHGPVKKPDMVAQVLTTAEVQAIVKLANEYKIPVTPRSSGIGFYGAGMPEQGGIVIDMSPMKKVSRIDKKNRWALFEAGVTYGELQAELAKQGMTAMLPFVPHRDKSVITSLLEREPRVTPKHHLDETIMTMEMVMPTGELFHTGSMASSPASPETIPDAVPTDLCNSMGPGLDWFRLIPGSLGSFAIVTVMNVKIGRLPSKQKMLFFGFKNIQEAVEPLYHMLRKLIGDESFLLNSRYMAALLAETPEDIDRLQAVLPPYTVMLNLTAGDWYAEDKMAYQEKAVREMARTFLVKPMETLPNAPGAGSILSGYLRKPWEKEAHWKWQGKGASKEVFFLTTLQRAPGFLQIIQHVAAASGYPLSAMGLYLQPKQNGRAFHMEVSFPYNPDDPAEARSAEAMHQQASEALVAAGAFF
jgi:FAD/FMN-containing dehydrogenase